MPFNGAGTFNRLYSWVTEALGGLPIGSNHMDGEMNGMAAGLTNCITRDGQSVPSADIPWGGKKITGLGAATAAGDALNQAAADARYAALGSGTGNSVLFTGAAGMTIGAGITSIRTAGYSGAGMGGGEYVYDALVDSTYVTTYPKAAFLAADGRGFRLSSTQTVNVQMFGAVGDDVTDDRPAFVAALAYLKSRSNTPTGNFSATPKLYVPMPAKAYYLSAGLNIHQSIHIYGDSSGQPDALGTLLRFAANNDCIVINDYRTDANTTASGLGGAGGTIIEGLAIWGGGATSYTGPYTNAANASGRGIFVRGILVKLIDLFVAFNASAGVDIHANAGSTGATQGNANEFYCERVWSTYNGGDGYVVYGTDANAGTMIQCSAVSNAGCGFKDYSFLGNTYLQCHARDNGITDPTGNNAPTGTCLYGGVRYYVVAGQEAAASTTPPGTNSAVWRAYSGYGGKTWVSGMTWVLGAPYATNVTNSNARNVFTGCYAESAQPPVQAFYPTLILGGLLEEVGVDGTAAWLRGGSSGGVNIGGPLNGGGYVSSGATTTTSFGGNLGSSANGTGDEVLAMQVTSGTGNGDIFKLFRNSSSGLLETRGVGSQVYGTFGLSSTTSPRGIGHQYFRRLFAGADGNTNNSVRLAGGLVTSANGETAQVGDLFFSNLAAPGTSLGKVCTTAGTIGSTAVFSDLPKVAKVPAPSGADLITNGDFASGTGWTTGSGSSISGGQGHTGTTSGGLLRQAGSGATGQSYRLTYTVVQQGNCGATLLLGTPGNDGQILNQVLPAAGTYTIDFVASSNTPEFTVYNGAGGTTEAIIDNVSIKALIADGIQSESLLTSGGSVGYATGAGGTVTQATSKSTGVALDKSAGQIVMNAASLAAGASVSFTLTNAMIVATDVVLPTIASGATADSYHVSVTATAAGSCRIQVRNFTAGALAESLVLNFALLKSVSA